MKHVIRMQQTVEHELYIEAETREAAIKMMEEGLRQNNNDVIECLGDGIKAKPHPICMLNRFKPEPVSALMTWIETGETK